MNLPLQLSRRLVAALVSAVLAVPVGAQSGPRHVAADTKFMQGMIGHHAQAVEMSALVRERTTTAAIRSLAERITVSQTDEIAWMESWLRQRGEALPDAHAHHGAEHARMPGMLTDEQMASLRAARGVAFDRLFLQLMIQHHEGALVMVAELHVVPGAGQEAAAANFVSEVDADQRMEIVRMRAMLNTPSDRE